MSSESIVPGLYGVISGAGDDSIVSSRSTNSRMPTQPRWHACSCTDHLPLGGRRFSRTCGISRTSGTTIDGARSKASMTAADDSIRLACDICDVLPSGGTDIKDRLQRSQGDDGM